MRLLDTTTKELKTFYGETIPGYAILSHMWGREEDEVLFRHIAGSDAEKREGKQRKGYAKIKGACKQAIEDGRKYIWIDTCCIDKSSSAELSEAINSMFEWYWKSEVCYVYLEDVGSGGDMQPKSDKDALFPTAPFERSRWFTRGWTLQELIAPQFVVFYSKDWVDIGTKGSLRNTISDVTRIRVEMLMAYDPEKASVAEKISWAAFRKTTRTEDAAYCLMGLLGVNMPLLYGEGNRAFRRLQEEFMEVSDDDSLFAWKSHLDDYSNYLKDSRGMLANSPWEFRDGANIVRSKDGAYSPYSMTNQGLQIKLPLLPIGTKRDIIHPNSENIFKTILKCTTMNKQPARQIVIYLKKTPEGRYQRILPHWLDETETPPNEMGLTTLLVPQVDTLTTRNRSNIPSIEIEILPTDSGFTADGRRLVEGHKSRYRYDLCFLTYNRVLDFSGKEKRFGVAFGLDEGIPWLDFIDVIDGFNLLSKNPYDKGGSRAHLRERHLNRLFQKIPGGDWWLTVSVRKIKDIQRGPCFRAVIYIQRDRVQAKGRYIPPAVPVSISFSSDFPDNLDHHDVHPDFKKEGYDWVAMFNPKIKKVLDVDLMYSHTIRHKFSNLHHIQFSRDGKYLATNDEYGKVKVLEMETGLENFHGGSYEMTNITSICFSPNGKFFATGDSDGYIYLWHIGTRRKHKSFPGHQAVNFLCFSFDGHLLIAGLEDTVQIWEIDNDTPRIITIRPNYRAYGTNITSIAVSPNDRLVASGSSDGIIRIWEIATTQLLEESLKHGDVVSAVAFTPDGKGLVSGSANGTLKYWDTSGLVPAEIKMKFEEFSDLEASSVVAECNLGKKTQHGMTFRGHKRPVTSVTISQDGQWLISGSKDGCVLFWDLNDATAQFILKTQPGWISPLFSTSPAGNTIFASFEERNETFRVWRYNNI